MLLSYNFLNREEAEKVLFAGDLVFYERTPTTPQADVARWLDDLAVLHRLPFKVLVPT